MTLSRRHVLLGTTALGLAGCATLSGLTLAQAETDLQSFGTSAINAINEVVPGTIPAAIVTTVTGDFTLASTVANTLTPSLAVAAAATGASQVVDYINTAFAVLADPPINGLIPPPFNIAVAAINVLLPGIEQFFGLGATAAASPRMAAVMAKSSTVRMSAAASAPSIVTPADARAALARFAVKAP
jgi:hypothetical protein